MYTCHTFPSSVEVLGTSDVTGAMASFLFEIIKKTTSELVVFIVSMLF